MVDVLARLVGQRARVGRRGVAARRRCVGGAGARVCRARLRVAVLPEALRRPVLVVHLAGQVVARAELVEAERRSALAGVFRLREPHRIQLAVDHGALALFVRADRVGLRHVLDVLAAQGDRALHVAQGPRHRTELVLPVRRGRHGAIAVRRRAVLATELAGLQEVAHRPRLVGRDAVGGQHVAQHRLGLPGVQLALRFVALQRVQPRGRAAGLDGGQGLGELRLQAQLVVVGLAVGAARTRRRAPAPACRGRRPHCPS
jgi:hypothetical protein